MIFYVKENYRGNDVGTNLIKYRENFARVLGFPHIYVSVDPLENPKMLKLITKLSYEVISAPSSKSAIYYKEDGSTYDKTYTRIDFKKLLG